MLYLGAVTTAGAYAIYTLGLREVPASGAGIVALAGAAHGHRARGLPLRRAARRRRRGRRPCCSSPRSGCSSPRRPRETAGHRPHLRGARQHRAACSPSCARGWARPRASSSWTTPRPTAPRRWCRHVAARDPAVELLVAARPSSGSPPPTRPRSGACSTRRRDDCVVTMDADFSHDPRYVPALVAAAGPARPRDRLALRRRRRHRQLGRAPPAALARAGNWYARAVTGTPVRDLTAGFTCMRTDFLRTVPFERDRGPRLRLADRAQDALPPARRPHPRDPDPLRRAPLRALQALDATSSTRGSSSPGASAVSPWRDVTRAQGRGGRRAASVRSASSTSSADVREVGVVRWARGRGIAASSAPSAPAPPRCVCEQELVGDAEVAEDRRAGRWVGRRARSSTRTVVACSAASSRRRATSRTSARP